MERNSKIILALIILVIVTFALFPVQTTIWSESKDLTEGKFNQSKPRVAVSRNTVHVVWESQQYASGSESSILYRRSTDGGNTWDHAVRLADESSYKKDPDIATFGDSVHVVWEDQRKSATTGRDIYLRSSDDNGATWKTEQLLTSDPANQRRPRVAAYGESVHVTWLDERNMATADYDLYYRRSTSSGRTWDSEQRLTSNPAIQWRQSMAVYEESVYVVYEDYRDWRYSAPVRSSRIYYVQSTDGGASWSAENKLPTNGLWQFYPDVAASANYVYITWSDGRTWATTKLDIWFIRSTDQGGTWSDETRITSDSGRQEFSRIAAEGRRVYIAWQDLESEMPTGTDIFYREGGRYGTDWNAPMRLSGYQWQDGQAVAASNAQVYLVWAEESLAETGGTEIFCRQGTPQSRPLCLVATDALLGVGPTGKELGTPIQAAPKPAMRRLVTPREAAALIQKNKNNQSFAILDFRTPEEFKTGHIENAVNIDYYVGDRTNNSKTIRGELNKLDKNKTYLIYCLVDFRARATMDMMEHLGFREVQDISGGIVQWTAEGLPTVK